MNQQRDPAQALLELAKGTEKRSKIGRLRGVYDEIETAQKAGVSNSAIVETLNKSGFELTLKTFETMLYRIRKEKKEEGSSESKQTTKQPAITTEDNQTKPVNINNEAKTPESGEPVKKITNPQQVRAARKREINLDDYKD